VYAQATFGEALRAAGARRRGLPEIQSKGHVLMRRLGLRGVMTTALAALAIPLACAGGATAASTSVWPSATALGLPSGASAASSLPSVSCGSSSQCVAVGADTAGGVSQPIAFTANNGVWSAGSAVGLPQEASSGSLSSVSCTAAGTCIAVGEENGGTHPITASDLNGTWSGATSLPAIGGTLSGISCRAGNDCSAVGSNAGQPITANVIAGAFSATSAPALPAGAQGGELAAVACTTPGNCTAVGSDPDSSGNQQAMVAAETAGTWGQAAQVALPAGATADSTPGSIGLNAIACPKSGHCTAAGSYVNAAGQQAAMVVTESSTWGQAVGLGLPAGASASVLDSISCANVTNCTATGSVVAGTVAPLAATESGGAWSAATTLPTPSGATSSASLAATALAVGCTGPEKCEAVGTYPTAAGVGAMALNSHPSLSVASHSLPHGAIGSPYHANLATRGGTGGDVWSLTGGSLPTGLSLNGGVVSGTPTANQTTTFSVAVHDNATPPDQATATLSITIGPATKPAKTKKKKSGGKKRSKKGKAKKGAKVGAFKVVHGSAVSVKVTCLNQRHCNGRVAVIVIEHLRGKRVIAINSSTRRAHGTHTKTVWLGSVRYRLRGGHHVTHTIRLNRTGTRLLKTKHKLHVAVALRPASAKHATIKHRVKLHQHKTKKHKKHKKHATKKKGTHSS
jgi:Putative Ig domain